MPLSIAHQRLANQRLMTPAKSIVDVVAHLGAVQAQDYLASLWALGLRTREASEAAVEQAIEEHRVVRTWPMRGTLHYVAADDARWMLDLMASRAVTNAAGRYRQLELDAAVFSKARKIAVKALEGDKRLTRPAMLALWRDAGIATTENRGNHILGHLAQEGTLCLGPRAGKQQTVVLLDEWAPRSRRLPRDEALAEIAARYFSGHGPATIGDFVWWTGLTIADAKAAIAAAGERLRAEIIDGVSYWSSERRPRRTTALTNAHLLPAFDEYLVAYKDRSAVLSDEHTRFVNAGGGMLAPTVIVAGRAVGRWTRELDASGAAVHASVSAFSALTADERASIDTAASRYGDFLGLDASVSYGAMRDG